MLDTARPAPAAASGLTRLAIPAAVLAGVLAVALGAFQLLAPAQPADGRPFVRFSDYVIEILFAASLLATLGAVLLLARYHRELGRWGTLGMIAASAYALGLGLVGISAAATAIRGVDTLGVIQFPAVGLWLVAGLLMAIAVARARVLPILIGLGFAAALPASMALGNSGPLALALLWIALAAALARRMAVARAGRLVNSRSDRYAHLPILPACRAAHPELHRTAGQHAAPPGPGPPDDRGTQEESP